MKIHVHAVEYKRLSVLFLQTLAFSTIIFPSSAQSKFPMKEASEAVSASSASILEIVSTIQIVPKLVIVKLKEESSC